MVWLCHICTDLGMPGEVWNSVARSIICVLIWSGLVSSVLAWCSLIRIGREWRNHVMSVLMWSGLVSLGLEWCRLVRSGL